MFTISPETLEETIESGALCITDLRLAYKKRLKNKNKNFPKKKLFFFYLFSMQLFSADATMFSKFCLFFFDHKKLKNPPQKVAHNRPRPFFFSAAPTAQNSPELHFRFINSSIQSSLLRSLHMDHLLNSY